MWHSPSGSPVEGLRAFQLGTLDPGPVAIPTGRRIATTIFVEEGAAGVAGIDHRPLGSEQCSLRQHRAREQPRRNKPRQGAPSPSFPPTSSGFPVFCSAGCVSLLPVWCVPVPTGAVSFPFKKTTFAKRVHRPAGCPAPPPILSGFSLFCSAGCISLLLVVCA